MVPSDMPSVVPSDQPSLRPSTVQTGAPTTVTVTEIGGQGPTNAGLIGGVVGIVAVGLGIAYFIKYRRGQ